MAVAGLGAIVAILILFGVSYIANQLETIEDKIAYKPPAAATEALPVVYDGKRHAIYVPAYSHIYSRGGQAFMLEVTLSVRNTDPEHEIRIERVSYFDTKGDEIRSFDGAAIRLGPLETVSYLVEAGDIAGGSGANFIVEWAADGEVNAPIAEAVMTGIDGTHQLSFASRGKPIARH